MGCRWTIIKPLEFTVTSNVYVVHTMLDQYTLRVLAILLLHPDQPEAYGS